ncbi:Late embryoproteinsis abundant (LEA) hydroxyproline-rich glycoprotein family, putative isoform 1 [Hibiscus syriacus]|uniref:Late embryoproteinsis abundant (LEA) hydroxyproline-rich glycoprotein family, putative isoform 1 n=1 Tax=Hibiscus syriacus TaxID=106335 RepID=A0A6A3CW01_HIBSY|nr:Late embryoproteinsis abundant (LEA) hydroxyproline-rich glycoprotein family, putative isoform 1 [Hibiscus syriacus]
MGASASKVEEDQALQLCRERKKYVRQALDGRCLLAAAHVAYIETLKSSGTALRKFVELEAPVESSLYTSTNATPEPLALAEKSLYQFSYSPPSFSQRVDATETFSPSPSPPTSSHFQVNRMRFGVTSSRKVKEKPPVPNIRLVTSSSTPQNTTPCSTEKPESSPFDTSSPPRTPEWDFFGLSHPIDRQLSFQEGKELNQGPGTIDDFRRHREEELLPKLEDEEGASLHEREETQGSDDEFDDEPPADTLVRSFENLNRVNDNKIANVPSDIPSVGSVASETDFVSREKNSSPDLSPLQGTPRGFSVPTEIKRTPVKEEASENEVAPKDFFSVMKDIEFLFVKASDSGKEVPRMLEANKLHFRPIFPGKGNRTFYHFRSIDGIFRAFFSCGEDQSQVKEELPQSDVKYLAWHRTTSSQSSSSRNPLELNSKDDIEDLNNNLFYNGCMISGSHASTLDRLYVWERKLYDEVKASETVRSEYDLKCKFLRQLESRAESSSKIDKTRAVVKDLHSRIRVAIQRIHSISKRIEDLRDNELQPQLEELIEGLSRMWEVMSECHRRQFQIISVAYKNGTMKISSLSESHRPITAHLEHELSSLFSSFTKWIGALKAYLKTINSWLGKCVSIPPKLKRSKRKNFKTELLRARGPPIYKTCGSWYDKLDSLEPSIKQVSDSIKLLAADTSGFLPHQEKNEGKNADRPYAPPGNNDNSDSAINMSREDDVKENTEISDSTYNMFRDDALKDSFGTSLVFFIGQLKSFAEASVKMYAELDREIRQAKHYYELYVKGAEVGNEENNVQSNDQSDN